MRFDKNGMSWLKQRQPQEMQKKKKIFQHLRTGEEKKTSQAGGLSG